MAPGSGSGGEKQWRTSAATIAVGDAGDVKAPRADGHSLRPEDAANSSRGGGSHGGVLWEGAEDGAGQGHQHRRGLDEHSGVLVLPDTAAGQQAGATGLAEPTRLALLYTGHVLGHEGHLER
ncbi:hypothetical protein DV515_00016748, partial [Chloebia gouldiae]